MTNLEKLLEESKRLREEATPGPYLSFEAGPWGSEGFGISIGDDVNEWLSTTCLGKHGENALFFAHAANNSDKFEKILKIMMSTMNDLKTGIYHTSRVTAICEESMKQINEIAGER